MTHPLSKVEQEEYEGIISKNEPIKYSKEKLDINSELMINTVTSGIVKKELFRFIYDNGLSISGNSYLIHINTIINRVYTYLLDSNNLDEYLGFAVSVPHALKFNNEIIETGLTTYLTVSLKYRKMGLARYLISDIINYGWGNNIYTGYHYIGEAKTSSNILVYSYFRPLNISKALEAGYQFNPENMKVSLTSDYTIRESVIGDFELLNKVGRKINIHLTEKIFNNLLQDCKFYTTMRRDKVTGIIGIKPILLRIGRTNTLCNIARVVYLETLDRHVYQSVMTMIKHLSTGEYIVMSGVCFGNLVNENIKHSVGMITTGKLYLDFYNLSIKETNKHSGDINMLYI
jgi:hypothetical protein